jgi:hypothetical protein
MVEYGVCHVIAVDGYSGKITAFHTMPIKNNILIYDNIYRYTVMNYGLFDQLRVDHGKEFYLSLYVQDNLKDHRHNTTRLPYIQTPSTRNHKVERLWVEVNTRVNYPLKAALHELNDQDVIDMGNETTKFCVSHVTQNVATVGMNNVVSAWNAHTIPGVGIPNSLFEENRNTTNVPLGELPTGVEAAADYNQHGGRITEFGVFGHDPLSHSRRLLHQRDIMFSQSYPDLSVLMSYAVNGHPGHFQNAVLRFNDITENLLP